MDFGVDWEGGSGVGSLGLGRSRRGQCCVAREEVLGRGRYERPRDRWRGLRGSNDRGEKKSRLGTREVNVKGAHNDLQGYNFSTKPKR